jgi:serine/threonine protein kinase
LKSFEKSKKDRVLNEVKILQNLSDTNVVGFVNWYETRNHFWIIYEYLSGGSLSSIIKEDSGLPEVRIKPFMNMLLSGLVYIHSQNILYCDLKPSNFVIDEYANMKFADFGGAIFNNDSLNLDSAMNINYIAPEVLLKESKPNFKSDIWGVGCLLYHLSTGKVLFEYNQNIENVEAIVQIPIPFLKEFSTEFNSLLRGMLEINTKKRYSWQELVVDPWIKELSSFQQIIKSKQILKEFLNASGSAKRLEKSEGKFSIISQANNVSVQDQNPLNFTSLNASHATNNNLLSSPFPRIANPSSTNSNNESVNENAKSYRHENANSTTSNFNIIKSEVDNPIASSKVIKSEDISLEDPKSKNFNSMSQPNQIINTKSATPNPFFSNLEIDNDFDECAEGLKVSAYQSMTEKDIRRSSGSSTNLPNNEKEEYIPMREELSFHRRKEDKTESNPFVINFHKISQNPEIIFKNNAESHLKIAREIVFSHSDHIIHPIIFNTEIEPLVFNFENLQQPEMIFTEPSGQNEEETKHYLLLIYKYLASDVSVNCKMFVLVHMMKIISKGNIANLIADSYIFDLLIKLLKVYKLNQIRIILCSLIGLVLRHTTTISLQINNLDLIELFILIAKDSPEGILRSRALGALGEFLFYSATQGDEQNIRWSISESIISRLLQILQDSKNTASQLYILKTIENITALACKNGTDFAKEEFVKLIISTFDPRKPAYLNSTIFAILLNTLKINSNLRPLISGRKYLISYIAEISTGGNNLLATNALSLLNHIILFGSSSSFGEIIETAILNNWSRFMEAIQKGEIIIRTRIIIFLISTLCIDNRFISLIVKTFRFPEILDSFADILIEGMEKVDQNSNFDFFSKTFILLAEVFKNYFMYFVQNFCDIMSNQDKSKIFDLSLTDSVVLFLKYIRLVLTSNFLKEKFIEEKEILVLFGCIEKLSLICKPDQEEILDLYLNCIELILRSDEILQRSHQFFANSVIGGLVQNVFDDSKLECRNLKFKIFIEVFNKVWTESDTRVHPVQAKNIFEFCIHALCEMDLETITGSLKVIRNLLEKNLISICKIEPNNLLHLLSVKIKENPETYVGFNSFGILFYILAEFSNFIYDYQKEGYFELTVNYLLAFSECEQFEEIFGFLNLYLEILHKLIKTKQTSQPIFFKGDTISQLLSFLDNTIIKLNHIYIEDIINIVYYIICITLNGVRQKVLIYDPPICKSSFTFVALPFFGKSIQMTEASKKKFIKLNTLLKQF